MGKRNKFFSLAKVNKWFIRAIGITWIILSL